MDPEPTNIETANYYARPLGASWVIRDKNRGEVIALRPDHRAAERCMEGLEESGGLK